MLFNKRDCGGASSAPFTLEPTTVPSVTDNPPGGGAMASGVHAANRATGSRTLPFKSSAFICHPWFLPAAHIPNHRPRIGWIAAIEGEWGEGDLLIRGISMLIHDEDSRWQKLAKKKSATQTFEAYFFVCFLLQQWGNNQQSVRRKCASDRTGLCRQFSTDGGDYVPHALQIKAILTTGLFITQIWGLHIHWCEWNLAALEDKAMISL